ncbi:hypothetical protein [Pseudaminobacter soli (ex Li et al. 2025)]|uniref:hypothetical protein n=1 Tax=Pseudaminobacter soli (ex Li et al. 2025) TaxID=1295366 RepID=UPI0011B1F400|nr:hypothetical protein [Mesorhizobium soli]
MRYEAYYELATKSLVGFRPYNFKVSMPVMHGHTAIVHRHFRRPIAMHLRAMAERLNCSSPNVMAAKLIAMINGTLAISGTLDEGDSRDLLSETADALLG